MCWQLTAEAAGQTAGTALTGQLVADHHGYRDGQGTGGGAHGHHCPQGIIFTALFDTLPLRPSRPYTIHIYPLFITLCRF